MTHPKAGVPVARHAPKKVDVGLGEALRAPLFHDTTGKRALAAPFLHGEFQNVAIAMARDDSRARDLRSNNSCRELVEPLAAVKHPNER